MAPKKSAQQKTIEELKAEYEAAVKEEIQRRIEDIPKEVKEVVNRLLEEVVGGVLGLERRWEKWEIKHSLSNQLHAFVQTKAALYVAENGQAMADQFATKLSKQAMKDLQHDYKAFLEENIETLLVARAKDAAELLVGRLLDNPEGAQS